MITPVPRLSSECSMRLFDPGTTKRLVKPNARDSQFEPYDAGNDERNADEACRVRKLSE